jgi:phospholipid/cholesterol/gamma-HCH transport system permease protein
MIVMMPLLVLLFGWSSPSSAGLHVPISRSASRSLTFLQRMQEVVPIYDLWVGLIKAPVFGLIVALTGCYQGMQVEGNSENVGIRTTAAVVQAIFMVIVLDAFFAVFFTEIGWA